MKRREFLGVLGSAAAAWPLVTHAQQGEIKRIGVLISTSQDDPQMERQIAAFRGALQTLGWIEGRNLRIDTRFPANDPARTQTFAAELVALKPDVLLASGPTTVLALQRIARATPIIFTQVNDPVGAGLVVTLAHPGANVAGFTPAEFSIGGKLLELLKEIAPGVGQVGVLLDPGLSDQTGMWRAMEQAATSAGIQLRQFSVQDRGAVERAITEFAAISKGGLIVLANRTTIAQRDLIIALVAKHRLPAIYSYRFFVDDGGLVSYGTDLIDLYRRAATYAHRIFRGENPADLPVQQPTKYEFVINLRTARHLALMYPQLSNNVPTR